MEGVISYLSDIQPAAEVDELSPNHHPYSFPCLIVMMVVMSGDDDGSDDDEEDDVDSDDEDDDASDDDDEDDEEDDDDEDDYGHLERSSYEDDRSAAV